MAPIVWNQGRAKNRPVLVKSRGMLLEGDLAIPSEASGLVIFACGSGSSRHSPRTLKIAEALERSGMATLLIDLLTEDEAEEDAQAKCFRFDIALLASRLSGVIEWALAQPELYGLPIGLFGASTSAAAAIIAAAEHPADVVAVVSRGGRPDLAGPYLGRITAPTLLIVGGHDEVIMKLNESAWKRIRAANELVVIPGATHLFEEPGALSEVARLASRWFASHIARRPLEAVAMCM
jgi:putative phosphoribosyl transferase